MTLDAIRLARAGLFLGVAALGCAGSVPVQEVGPRDLLTQAEGRIQKGDHLQAIEILTRITVDYPGFASIDRVVFLLGTSHLETGDYVQSEADFTRVIRDYPFSEYSDDASFLVGEGFYRQRGRPSLDPMMAETALEKFQRFLVDYPESPRTTDARAAIRELSEFLARKKYDTASLYFRLKAYRSVEVYCEHLVAEYPDVEVAPDALWLMARARMRMNEPGGACEAIRTLSTLPQIERRGEWLRHVRDESAAWSCGQGESQAQAGG
jgi:outer membrane assembly lipoprotein YfiO